MNKRRAERSYSVAGYVRLRFNKNNVFSFPILEASSLGIRMLYNWNTIEVLYGKGFIQKDEQFDMSLEFDELDQPLEGVARVVWVKNIKEVEGGFEVGLEIIDFQDMAKKRIEELVEQSNVENKKQLEVLYYLIDSRVL